MLKQRRGGIQTDVNGAELAASLRNSKDITRKLISKLLELGFLPTQIGDNIAIATGGATYYRNRINKYIKQGLSKKEAEAKKYNPIIQKYSAGKKLSPKEFTAINDFGIKMRPVTYTMLQFIINEPKMTYEDVSMMMEVLDDFDTDTLLGYVSVMTSEKASVMKRVYDKRMAQGVIPA
jgi:hypothetical protein